MTTLHSNSIRISTWNALLKCCKKAGWILFPFGLLVSGLDHFLTTSLENALKTEFSMNYQVLFFIFLNFCILVLKFPIQVFIITGSLETSLNETSLNENSEKKIHFSKISYLIKESLRSWGKTFQWSLFLLIPGFFAYIFYIYVPFVVLLDKNYSRGQIDALRSSMKRVQTSLPQVLGLMFLFAVLIPFLISLIDDWQSISDHVMGLLALSLVNTLADLIFTIYLLKLFMRKADLHETFV